MYLTHSILLLAAAGVASSIPAPPQDYAAEAVHHDGPLASADVSVQNTADFEAQRWGWGGYGFRRMNGFPYMMSRPWFNRPMYPSFYNYLYGGPYMRGGFVPFSEPDYSTQSVPDEQNSPAPQSVESLHASPLTKRDTQDSRKSHSPYDHHDYHDHHGSYRPHGV